MIIAKIIEKYIKLIQEYYLKNINSKSAIEVLIFAILLVIFAAPPLFWNLRIGGYELLGSGDFLSPFNLHQQTYSLFFTYNTFTYGGMDASFLIAQLFPFYLFYLIFNLLGIPSSVITLLFLFSILLLSEMSMFFYIRNVLLTELIKNKFTIKLLSFLGAVTYALSPYVIGIIEPGHFLQLLLYATMPLVLIIVSKILADKGYQIKSFIYLFIIFFLDASAFANFGLIYVTLLILSVYYISFSIVTKSLIRNIPKYFFIIAIPFLSNIWWLTPFLSNLGSTITLDQASNTLMLLLNVAIDKASILNLFYVRGEGLLFNSLQNTLYDSPFILFIFIILIIFMFYALLKSKKNATIVPLMILVIIGIFISKGSQEPFGNLFILLYNHLPGFQIFRRPVSKFYWVYILAMIPLAMIGISIFLQHVKNIWYKMLVILILSTSVVCFWLSFISVPLLVPFTIPNQYYQADQYLRKNNVNKILIIPGFYGTYPTYNKVLFNNYYGLDFLNYIWQFSQLVPDSSVYSPNLPYKNQTNEAMSLIRKGKSICSITKDLGITQIMVRQDIDLNGLMEDKPQKIISLLNKSSEISSHTEYFENGRPGFTIYQIQKDCVQQNSIALNGTSKNMEFNMDSPVKYEVKISNIKGGEVLTLLNNYSSNWNLYLNKKPVINYENKNVYTVENIQSNFKDISLLTDKAYNSSYHVMTNGYANGWKINISELKKLGNIKENSDGTYTLSLILYYKTQLYFYVGIVIFSLEIAAIMLYMIYSVMNKNKN